MTSEQHAEAVARAVRVFNSASDHFDDSPLWSLVGEDTVRRLELGPGNRVVDLCAGSGASALPAARVVGPSGSVTAVDVAEDLLALAARKAEDEGLTQLRTLRADATASGLPPESYDAAVCVFGVFLVPDMIAFVRQMWGLVRPGGKLAITNWGQTVFAPVGPLFWQAMRDIAPELMPPDPSQSPWASISTPGGMAKLFADAGTTTPAIENASYAVPVPSPEHAWTAVLGSGYRGTVDALDPLRREQVQRQLVEAVRRDGVTENRADVMFAVAVKPAE